MKKRLEYYGGEGFENCQEHWTYDISYGSELGEKAEKTITGLTEARRFYDSINGGKAFWNPRTNELIDCWVEID